MTTTEPDTISPTAPTTTPSTQPSPAGDGPKAKPTYIWGVGRRKKSVARVRIAPGSGKIAINERELNEYLTNERDRKGIFGPLEVTNSGGKIDVLARCSGGGPSGQAGALILGLARALVRLDPSTEGALRNAGFLTRDSRMKERKKYGQRGARRRFQFSKR
jgi:small subunit ribosomal protein S9